MYLTVKQFYISGLFNLNIDQEYKLQMVYPWSCLLCGYDRAKPEGVNLVMFL